MIPSLLFNYLKPVRSTSSIYQQVGKKKIAKLEFRQIFPAAGYRKCSSGTKEMYAPIPKSSDLSGTTGLMDQLGAKDFFMRSQGCPGPSTYQRLRTMVQIRRIILATA